jgi:hypothetical protein
MKLAPTAGAAADDSIDKKIQVLNSNVIATTR